MSASPSTNPWSILTKLSLYFNWQLKYFFGINLVLLGTKFPELNKFSRWDTKSVWLRELSCQIIYKLVNWQNIVHLILIIRFVHLTFVTLINNSSFCSSIIIQLLAGQLLPPPHSQLGLSGGCAYF